MRFLLPVSLLLVGVVVVHAAYGNTKTNLAVYWGSNSAADVSKQDRLKAYCDTTEVDIFILAFVTDPTVPQLNFANQGGKCTNLDSSQAKCPQVSEDIKYCQDKGKTILLSIGGGGTTFNGFATADAAAQNAKLIWDTFGPPQKSTANRPFGESQVNGIDLDIENSTATFSVDWAKKLRELTTKDNALLTAAPQAPRFLDPMNPILEGVDINIAFVQFYNNLLYSPGGSNYTETMKDWNDWATDKKAKFFMGLPASDTATVSPGKGFLDPDTMHTKIQDAAKNYASFGGAMLWDASQSWANDKYHLKVKTALEGST